MSSTVDTDNGGRTEKYIAAALIGVHALLLAYLSIFRYIDRDEGFYLSAASQVAHGHTVYTDFFFPQMPFLPWIQSLVSGNDFSTLLHTRLLGLIPAILTPIVLYVVLNELRLKSGVRSVVLFLYCFSGMFLVWHSVAKTYAWTDCWLMLLFYCLVRGVRSNRIGYWLAAGAAFALAVNFRSVLVVTIVPVAYAWESAEFERKWQVGIAFLLAAALVSVPSIQLLIADPAHFYFNNLGFHFVRNPGVTFGGGMLERGEAVGKFLLNLQVWIVIAGTIVAWRQRQSEKLETGDGLDPIVLASLFAGMISLVYLFPSPVHVQYFEQALPFGLIAAAMGIAVWWDRGAPRKSGIRRNGLLVAGAVTYVLVLVPFAAVYLGAIRKDDRPYSIRNMTELCQYVKAHADSGAVMSEWAGVPVLSGCEGIAGLEYIGWQYPMPLRPGQIKEYHLPITADLHKLLEDKLPAVYVVWNAPDSGLVDIASKNYHLGQAFDQFKVLLRNEADK